jgi:RNA polymerase sigma-70 factor (ECF subfamily)
LQAQQLGVARLPAPSEATDDDVLARARAGDHEAFRVLVERHQGRLFRLAARVLRDEDLARDAVQDAFLKAYVSIRRFEGRSSLYTWLYRLTLNVCLDMRRRNKSDRTVEWPEVALSDGVLAAEPVPAAGTEPLPSGPDTELERSEIRQRVGQAIEELPAEARETLLLREVDGLSYAEIAETLSIPKGTVMSRLHYARRRVQKLLVASGIARAGDVHDDVHESDPAEEDA